MYRFLRLLFLLVLLSNLAVAQNKSLEYFAKVPTRFYKPGLSPMQSIRFSYRQTPGNQWQKSVGEMKLDLFQVKFSRRASLIFSGSAWAGYKVQKRKLYKINEEQAYERTRYYYAAPSVSAGVSYGFFFPFYINARVGVFKPWEGAFYNAYLPVQYSDQQGIQTSESEITYVRKGFGELQKYISVEIYRPFKRHFPDERPMGWSVGYTNYLDAGKGGWNAGLYWHIKAK